MDRLSSFRGAVLLGAVTALSGLSSTDAAAQKVDFSGKRIELLVPFPPGGGSDVYSRTLAPFLEKHLPGKPTIVVRNVPGGGSITGANQFHTRAKPDGLHALVF
jgi:tripartite-type tricarboxylate transporter receptor subunit TctC